MGASRKIKRSKQKQSKKDVKRTLNLFDKIPDHCLTCFEPYDRSNKEQAQTWNVVVREKENKVNLYCPTCWESATKFLKELQEEVGSAQTDT